MNEKKSLFTLLSPLQVFILGVVVSFFVLTSIGFFVLLVKGSSRADLNQVGKTTGNVPAAQVSPPTTAGNGPIVLAAQTGDEWYKGGEKADVTVIEFSDTECPFCKQFHNTMNQIIAEYGDRVKWIYKHAPLVSLHSKAPKEAEATECAGELGGNDGFWGYIDTLFEQTPSNNGFPDDALPQIAEDIGLDRSAFERCLGSGKYTAKVQAQLDEAKAAGLRGTPYSVIVSGDQKIPVSGAQPYAQIKAVIDGLL